MTEPGFNLMNLIEKIYHLYENISRKKELSEKIEKFLDLISNDVEVVDESFDPLTTKYTIVIEPKDDSTYYRITEIGEWIGLDTELVIEAPYTEKCTKETKIFNKKLRAFIDEVTKLGFKACITANNTIDIIIYQEDELALLLRMQNH